MKRYIVVIDSRPYFILITCVILLFVALIFLKKTKIGHMIRHPQMKVIVLSLFGVFGFALVPLLLALFLWLQIQIGNADVPVIRWLTAHAINVVYIAWLVFALGILTVVAARKFTSHHSINRR